MLGSLGSSSIVSFQKEFDDAVSCSYKTRVIGFIGCVIAGWICNIGGAAWMAVGDIQMFAGYFCAGSIFCITATCFLFTPTAQLKSMFDPIRAWASVVYLISIIATLVVAFQVGSFVAIVFCLLFQTAAYVWYCASYIPYGRAAIKSCLGNTCCPE